MPKLTPEQQSVRTKAIDAKEEDWKTIQLFLDRLSKIGGRHHGAALLGLLDLYEFHDGDLSQGFAPNYLGIFIFDLLQEIAWNGVAAIASNPEQIRKDLNGAIEEMRSDLLL